VDDQEANVILLDRLLRGAGYLSVTSTMNSREVAELHSQNRYDLIILDILMPGMDGFQVMEELKKNEKDSYLPVLVVTAQPEHKVRALKTGAKDFVSKPLDLVEVLTRVHNMLEVRLLHEQTRTLYDEVVLERMALVIAKNEISQHAIHLEQVVKERTSQLSETVRELEGFSYSVSHDMRAPLRAMQSYASFLVDDYGSKLDAEGNHYLQQIMRSSVRLDSLIRDVLNYTKIVHSRLPLEPVNLDRLVRDIVETYPNEQLVKPHIDIIGVLPTVMGNEALLTQCISNLLSNGAKFVAPGTQPHLEIWAEEREENVDRIWFKDNGLGIAAENHERIFGMFERIHPAEEYEGTGIGLTIVRKAAERMGAQIGFDSKLGHGSSFWIELKKT
jgi:signal transduction histidine kinase